MEVQQFDVIWNLFSTHCIVPKKTLEYSNDNGININTLKNLLLKHHVANPAVTQDERGKRRLSGYNGAEPFDVVISTAVFLQTLNHGPFKLIFNPWSVGEGSSYPLGTSSVGKYLVDRRALDDVDCPQNPKLGLQSFVRKSRQFFQYVAMSVKPLRKVKDEIITM